MDAPILAALFAARVEYDDSVLLCRISMPGKKCDQAPD